MSCRLVLLLLPVFAFAADVEYDPYPLHGLVLVGSKDDLLPTTELDTVQGMQLVNLDLPGSYKSLADTLEPLYEDQELTPELIRQLKQAIYRYYRAHEHPFVWIAVPPQDPVSGTVQLIVQESTLGKTEVVGNQWESSKRIAEYIRIQPGQPISQREVMKDVHFANKNPFRSIEVSYAPGEQENTTDLILKVQDRKPYRFYLGADNTGVLATGRQRVFAGFSWDQLFNLDHVIFYQYSTNYNVNRFHANTFQYMALLPWQSVLNVFGGFSILHANLPPPAGSNSGTNIQASLRYHIPIAPVHSFTHETIVGFDLKNTNNTMEFVDITPTFGQTVNLTQFVFGYQCGWDQAPHSLHAGAEMLFSPSAWLPDQTNEDFESLRPGAKHKWIYSVFFVDYQRALPRKCSYTLFFRSQWSSQTLLPSEQLGLGGYDTIRGYDQRQFNTDSGLFLSQELHSPTISLFRSKQPHVDRLYFLLFLDGGYGIDKVAVPDVKQHNWLLGIGPGLRYAFSTYFHARLDWGIKLHHEAEFTGGNSMLHFSVSGDY